MELDNLFNENESEGMQNAENIEDGGSAAEESLGTDGAGREDNGNNEEHSLNVQTPETNRLAAAARRKAEQELKSYRDEVDGFYRQNGYEGFADYRQKYEQEQRRRAMEEAPEKLGFSGNDINPMVRAIVSEMPEFKAAREVAEQNLKTQQRLAFEEQLKLITAIDPTIKTAEDLYNMENADKFHDLVFRNGLELSEAFRYVNMDRLMQQNEAKTRQDTLNRVNSKSHLSPVSGAPGDEFKVPDDVADEYRVYFPGITDEEIREHYKKNHDN